MNDSRPASNGPVRFGVFELDADAGELRKHGIRVKLQEQPLQVLQILLEKPGEVVTRDELQRRLWPSDTFVEFDKGIYNAIKRLRETLSDDAGTPRYIETLPKRGYRFIGQFVDGTPSLAVTVPVAEKSLSPAVESKRQRLVPGLAVGGATAVAVALLLAFNIAGLRDRLSGKTATTKIQSLAVLPLTNLSGDPGQEYFADGMTDALITDLVQIPSLKVIYRTSVMRYKKTDKQLPEIARELNVDGIIEGTVQRSGDQVKITAQMIHGPTDKPIWAKRYERDVRDVFSLQRDISEDIARQVSAQLTAPNRAQIAPPRSVDPQVLDAYLQAGYHLQRFGKRFGDEEKRKAAAYLEKAIQADPNFTPAYIELVQAHNLLWPASGDLAAMTAAANKAAALEPTSADTRMVLAGVKWAAGDWTEAVEHFRKAVALNPGSAYAHDSLGNILDILGTQPEAWEHHEIAQELDPNGDHLSWTLYRNGHYDRAIEILLRFTESQPDDVGLHWRLAQNYLQGGMYNQWIVELSTVMTLYGFPQTADRLQRAFATIGYAGALRQWAKELEHLNESRQLYYPGVLAQVYSRLGDSDRAFYWLEDAYKHRDRAFDDPYLWGGLKIDPGFASLRSDPRYKDLLRRIGLPP